MGNKSSLGDMYSNLKESLGDISNSASLTIPVNTANGEGEYRAKCIKCRDDLVDKCRKHIILDIYCNILPLDKEYIDGNKGQMLSDIDSMLQTKGMTPTQYLQSSFDNTKSPLVEYVLRATKMIGDQYMEAEQEKVNEAKEKDVELPPPEVPSEDDQDVNDQIVDIQDDQEYETFVDKLKEKTISKIVDDVSKIINTTKESNDIAFDPKPVADMEAEMESTTSLAMNYINNKLLKESIECTPELQEEIISMAIRESALNMLDQVFKQPSGVFREYASNIRYGKGAIVNEAAYQHIVEATKENVDDVVDKAKKEFDDKVNSKLKASDVLNNEEEKKKKEEENK